MHCQTDKSYHHNVVASTNKWNLPSKADPGAVFELAAGSYPPAVITGWRGTTDQPIVVRGPLPLPVDWTTIREVDRELYAVPIRQALDAGKLSLPATEGLAVVEGRGAPVGLLLKDCEHVRIEGLVVRDAGRNLVIQGSSHITITDCAVTGAESETGVALEPGVSRWVRFERVLAYGMKENGFAVEPGAAFDIEWDCCLAHGMQSKGGDGFCFKHVAPAEVDYRMRLVRCVALRNRLDGFDLGKGVGGVTLQFCLGDSNAWAEFYAKDLKVWSGGNTFRRCRMTGRSQFVSGSSTLEDFKTGTKFDSPEALK